MKSWRSRAVSKTFPPLVLVCGSGDIASAVAHRLFNTGYRVLIHESDSPTATRRKMAFTDAVFDGIALLEGIESRRADDLTLLPAQLAAREFIPLSTLSFNALLEHLHPDILIDARMRKHQQPETQISLAPLTIGLGPNFSAGENVHIAIETSWGADLGKVITHGVTKALEGEPKEIEGHARDRYVYAPHTGIFQTQHHIGDIVSTGEELARVDETPLLSPIAGVLRGLTHDGVPVKEKTKVIEVDPRINHSQVNGIGERPARIAEGVLEAIGNQKNK
jgi:xanthine dehydrogenase accessory factor